jgi:hypothetical protein
MSTNNQIIQAITVDIACGGGYATSITYMAQGGLLLMVSMRMMTVAIQSPTQAMSTVMAWMI